MPRGDGTGPRGLGSMTGRAAGYCAGFGAPGFANPIPRAGLGIRGGFGYFGRGRGFWGRPAPYAPMAYQEASVYPTYPTPVPPSAQSMQMPRDQELQMLEGQAMALEDQLKQIRERINQLKEQE